MTTLLAEILEALRDGAWFPVAVLIVGTALALWWAGRGR
jgi:hypothetical protein